jgi:hypothetical protein
MNQAKINKRFTALLQNPKGLSVRVVNPENKVCLQDALALVHRVYLRAGYITPGNAIEDEYTPQAIYLGVYTIDNIVATGRLISRRRKNPLKVEKVFNLHLPESHLDDVHYVEIGHLAYDPFIRQGRSLSAFFVSAVLYRCLFRYGRDVLKATHFVAGIDSGLFRKLNVIGVGFIKIGKPVKYMGSLTVPCMLELNSALDNLKIHGAEGRILAEYCAQGSTLLE